MMQNKKACILVADDEKEIRDVLDKPSSLVRPHDFLSVPAAESIYIGKIGQYQAA